VSALESWARSNVPLAAPGQEDTIRLRLVVNGVEKSVAVDPRTVLLDALASV
jgi:hypothetical protein